jgi:hypothetical protein
MSMSVVDKQRYLRAMLPQPHTDCVFPIECTPAKINPKCLGDSAQPLYISSGTTSSRRYCWFLSRLARPGIPV